MSRKNSIQGAMRLTFWSGTGIYTIWSRRPGRRIAESMTSGLLVAASTSTSTSALLPDPAVKNPSISVSRLVTMRSPLFSDVWVVPRA